MERLLEPVRAAVKAYWTPDLQRAFLTVFFATLAFSYAAHGFLFANEFFSHDSVSYFAYSDWGLSFYAGRGRFVIPIYEGIKGGAAAPWLIGLLFVFWMTLAAFLVIRFLDIRSRAGMILASGLLCTNMALTLTGATYVYCLDEYALSLFLAAAAAFLFRRGGWRAVAGLIPLVLSLGIYQSYFTVAMCLCMLDCLRRLTGGETAPSVLRRGIGYLALLALGFVLYYAAWNGTCLLLGVELMRMEESVFSGGLAVLPTLIWKANLRYFRFLAGSGGVLGRVLPVVHVLLAGLLFWRLLRLLADRELPLMGRSLLAVLACLLPTAFYSVFILVPGGAHYLMTFTGEFLYLLPLLAMEPGVRKRVGSWGRFLLCVLLCVVLWQHTVFANQAYMKKELEKNSTLFLAAQIVSRIEAVEGYVPGETPVAFAGRVDRNSYLNRDRRAFSQLSGWTGLANNQAATYNLGHYLVDYLYYPLLWDQDRDYASMEEVRAMPVYPAAGSIGMVDGTVVVKLSEKKEG